MQSRSNSLARDTPFRQMWQQFSEQRIKALFIQEDSLSKHTPLLWVRNLPFPTALAFFRVLLIAGELLKFWTWSSESEVHIPLWRLQSVILAYTRASLNEPMYSSVERLSSGHISQTPDNPKRIRWLFSKQCAGHHSSFGYAIVYIMQLLPHTRSILEDSSVRTRVRNIWRFFSEDSSLSLSASLKTGCL